MCERKCRWKESTNATQCDVLTFFHNFSFIVYNVLVNITKRPTKMKRKNIQLKCDNWEMRRVGCGRRRTADQQRWETSQIECVRRQTNNEFSANRSENKSESKFIFRLKRTTTRTLHKSITVWRLDVSINCPPPFKGTGRAAAMKRKLRPRPLVT